MRRNRVTTTTELTHVKRINKYLLFRPHISVEYNNISQNTIFFATLSQNILSPVTNPLVFVLVQITGYQMKTVTMTTKPESIPYH